MTKKLKISFCTVCMNRLEHLKKTLPKNIEDTMTYGNFEFVVLDYNSKDGLEEWIMAEMSQYRAAGLLIYVKTRFPEYFLRSHSKNVAAKHATGDIICNVDADNYIGEGFADYINREFMEHQHIYLTVPRDFGKKDCYGRICVLRDDFMAITGYDEDMTDYGFEDFDLVNRLELLGRKARYFSNSQFLQVLNHDDVTRIENEHNIHSINQIYLRYINHYSSELLYLFKTGVFYMGIVVINRLVNSKSVYNVFIENRKFSYQFSLQNNCWVKGSYIKSDDGIVLKTCNKQISLTPISTGKMQNRRGEIFYECSEPEDFQTRVMFFSQINNRIKMEKNKEQKIIRVNTIFGEINSIKNRA
ncbi:glycosyltransferase family 2 protein [Ulvibacterium marinum]|uniref:Glycosyltransferase family 2 protein n=1 Tax=Ulvibacterium marinum TaxID=2419782 RepID=A0A3B0BXN3_9FLAO|nr:glycosyltransferase family A protein [Ulvibacterium marinum]RKN76899.1 glycosyltransferase family 2 protein [Ulvibacterium marinum]